MLTPVIWQVPIRSGRHELLVLPSLMEGGCPLGAREGEMRRATKCECTPGAKRERAKAFHFRVRDGNGWGRNALTTRRNIFVCRRACRGRTWATSNSSAGHTRAFVAGRAEAALGRHPARSAGHTRAFSSGRPRRTWSPVSATRPLAPPAGRGSENSSLLVREGVRVSYFRVVATHLAFPVH